MNENLKYLHVKQGDITVEEVGAIVNAANPSLLGGGGVDGAIHRAAGPELLEKCKLLGGCKSGEARITGGYNLKAEYIIHTPGPIYKGGNNREKEILKNSYYNSLLLAKEKKINSVSFPAISTGIYSYPKREASMVAIDTVLQFFEKENYSLDVYFVLFDKENFDLYDNYIKNFKS